MLRDRNNPEQNVFRLLKPIYGEIIDEYWKEWNLTDPRGRIAIEQVLNAVAIHHLDMRVGDHKIYLDPPPAHLIGQGDYLIGQVIYPGKIPYAFRVPRGELLRHVFLLGPSGTGKTTLIIGILRQVLANGVPLMAIDWKMNYRCLLNDPHGRNIIVLTVGRNTAPLRLNMLQPPAGVETTEWVECLADTISTGYLLMQGARNPLKDALLKAIEQHGNRATLRDAFAILKANMASVGQRSRQYGWFESSERSIDELTKGPFGEALNERDNPMTIEELLRVTIVFELQGLGEDQKKTFCVFLLQAILLLRKNQHVDREILRHVLCFDEAQNVFPKEDWGKISVPSRMAREIREYGEAIIAGTQQTDVADSIMANCGIKVALQTVYPKDAELLSRLLHVTTEDLGKIPMGQAIARLPSRYYQAFLFSFPEQPIKNTTVSDDDVIQRYEKWRGTIPKAANPPPPAGQEPSLVEERSIKLVLDIAQNPISTVTQRYARLGWNPNAGNQVQQRIMEDGLAEFVMVDVGQGPMGRMKFLTLTPLGAITVEKHGGIVRPTGPAGVEHEFWRSRLKDRLQQHDYVVTEEYHLGDRKRVDLHATKKGKVILIEIETGNSDVTENIKKCNGHGKLIVFFTNTKASEGTTIPKEVTILTPATINDVHKILA